MMHRGFLERRGIDLVALFLVVGAGVSSCASDDPVRPSDPDCVVPTTTSFVDSAQGRVVVKDFGFFPASITVRAGQTVRWVHCGPELDEHTVTSDGGAGPLSSDYFGKGESFSFTFNDAGTFPYHCIPHATFMTGTVTVVPPAMPPES